MIDYLELYHREEDALWEAVRRLSEPLLHATANQENREGGDWESSSADRGMAALSDQMERHRILGESIKWLPRESEYQREKGRSEYERIRSIRDEEMNFGPVIESEDMKRGRSYTKQAFWGMGEAEQLDRIFRRDSRRYDGGFFLY